MNLYACLRALKIASHFVNNFQYNFVIEIYRMLEFVYNVHG